MGIIKKIRGSKKRRRAKRIEKQLIRSDDDFVVATLAENSIDNSHIDIKKVVINMQDPENKAKVVQNNFETIIEQDNVKDTLKDLPDVHIAQVVERHEDKLKESGKIVNAILPIKDNQKKLEYTRNNLSQLSDLELQRILRSLKLETDLEKKKDVERQKVKIIGNKFLENIEKYGSVFRLGDFTATLTQESKMDLFYTFMEVMANHENSEIIDFKTAKLRFAENFSYIAEIDWEKCVANELLTKQEVEFINSQRRKMHLQKQKKDKSNKNRGGR